MSGDTVSMVVSGGRDRDDLGGGERRALLGWDKTIRVLCSGLGFLGGACSGLFPLGSLGGRGLGGRGLRGRGFGGRGSLTVGNCDPIAIVLSRGG